VLRTPKFTDIATLVQVLEKNPFGSLIPLLLVLSLALVVWAAR
jgi:hypothetical protein